MPTSKTSPAAPTRGMDHWPSCPQCTRKMTVKEVNPVLFTSDVDDVVYGCEDCGTRLKRTVKRDRV